MVLISNRDFFSERAIDNEEKSRDPNQLHKNLERIIRTDVAANRKLVFKVSMDDYNKVKKKVAKAISSLSVSGIASIIFDLKITVIGDIDPIQAVSSLRKKVGYTEILSIGPAREEEEALSSSVTQGARGKQKLVQEKAPTDDASVSNIGQLHESMDISAQAEASTSLSMLVVEDTSFPQRPYTVMLDQGRTKDVMVERKRLLDDQEMSINRIVELERLLATQKELLATERVVLEELIAKDDQLEELNRALQVEKKKNVELAFFKENEYFKGVEDCRLKVLERYPELDLSWMDSEFGFRPMLRTINEVPATQEHK